MINIGRKLGIVVPAYNEEKRIGKTLDAYTKFLDNLKGDKKIDYEVLIVINNTKDNTEKIVKQQQKKNKKINYLNFAKGGKGFAVIEGFKYFVKKDVDLVGFVDADLATIPEAFYDLVLNIKDKDGIIANRNSPRSKILPKNTFRRIFPSRIFNFIVRSLFFINYQDTQCGAKLLTKQAAKVAIEEVKMSQWAFDVELLHKLNRKGFRIIQIPTIWREVEGGSIKLIKSTLQMLLAIIQLRVINSSIRRLVRPMKPLVRIIWSSLR